MPQTPAQRQARRRKRERAGLVHVDFWTDEASLTAILVDLGTLARDRADQPKAISAATKRLLEELDIADVFLARHA